MKYEQFLADVGKTRDEVEGMGRTLLRIKSVLSAAHDLVGKNERLEKENRELKSENARLKAEPGDWKGDAEGFESDAYMKLPLDAYGEPIRIGDVVNVEGDAMTVLGYRHDDTLLLIAKDRKSGLFFSPEPSRVRHFKYVQPDSWEKLEEDASAGAQNYCANRLDIDIRKTLTSDDDRAFAKDIIRRAKKLAGIEDLEGGER